MANLQMQYVSIQVNPRITHASDHSNNVNVVEVINRMRSLKLDENLHASGGPRKNLVPNDICAGLHMRHMAISHECHGWVAGELGFPQFGGPQEHVSPKTGRKLFGFVKP